MKLLVALSLVTVAAAYHISDFPLGDGVKYPTRDEVQIFVCAWHRLLNSKAGQAFTQHVDNLKYTREIGSMTMRDFWNEYFEYATYNGLPKFQALQFRKDFMKLLNDTMKYVKHFIIHGTNYTFGHLNRIMNSEDLTLDQARAELVEIFEPLEDILQPIADLFVEQEQEPMEPIYEIPEEDSSYPFGQVPFPTNSFPHNGFKNFRFNNERLAKKCKRPDGVY